MSLRNELGEQLALEWQQDPASQVVWEAMHAIESGKIEGKEELVKLGEMGSNVAKIYLGKYYLHGYYCFEKDVDAGLRWLESASQQGSVEAKFGLAQQRHYLGQICEAKRLYQELSEVNYSPAQYRLANILLQEPGEQSKSEALKLLRKAETNGHMHAANKIANLYLQLIFGPTKWPVGLFKKICILAPFLKTGTQDPLSNKFRK